MQFRWVAFITLWSTLVGPILGTPSGPKSSARTPQVKTVQALPASTPAPRR